MFLMHINTNEAHQLHQMINPHSWHPTHHLRSSCMIIPISRTSQTKKLKRFSFSTAAPIICGTKKFRQRPNETISKAVLLSPLNKPSLWDNEKAMNMSSKDFDIKVVWNIHWAKLENSPNFNKVANKYHIMKVPPRGKSKKVKWMMNS